MASFIIPVHNEGSNLFSYVEKFILDIGEKINTYEIILVENGSQDNTFTECERLRDKYGQIIVIIKCEIPSYGESIKQGLIAAQFDTLFVYEVDFLEVDFIWRALDKIHNENYDFVVGSKRHSESQDMRPFKRRLLTFLFNKFLKFYFNFTGTDTHGLKALRKSVFKKINNFTITTDEVYQTELVLLAYSLDLKVTEVPVELRETRSPSVSIIKRLPKVLKIVVQLKRSLSRKL